MNQNNQELPANVNWSGVLFNLKKQKLVPFLGAGASLGFNGNDGLPTAGELAKYLAEECDFPDENVTDLFRVSQYFSLNLGESRLREAVKEKLTSKVVQPGEVHNILASWPIDVVFTTNYDPLMEHAFVMAGKYPAKVEYNRNGDQKQITSDPTIKNPLVYKLHGSLEDIDSMVITEDNYIDFLISLIEGNPKVPDTISKIFRTSTFLFIGYGLKDWNIRVLLRYFRTQKNISFAVQKETSKNQAVVKEWDSMVLYWVREDIFIYNCDALCFLRELNRRYLEEKNNG